MPGKIGALESVDRASKTQSFTDRYAKINEALIDAKALNPMIAMHRAMDEALKATLNSTRKERTLDKAFRSYYETTSMDKSQEYADVAHGTGNWLKPRKWKNPIVMAGRDLSSGIVAAAGVAGMITSTKYADVSTSIQTFVQGANQTISATLDGKLQENAPKHDFYIGLARSLYENGQASVQRLQGALDQLRSKQLELIKLEGRAQGAPGA